MTLGTMIPSNYFIYENVYMFHSMYCTVWSFSFNTQ